MLKRGVIACCISSLLGLVGFALAQDDERIPYDAIWHRGWVQDVKWMPDDRTVEFIAQGDSGGFRNYQGYRYSVFSEQLQFLESWYRSETLNKLQNANVYLPLATDKATGKPSRIYPSPNHQFVVYGVDIGDVGVYEQINRVYGLAITNLATRQTKILEGVYIPFPSHSQYVDIIWSGDSSAFAYNMLYGVSAYSVYIDNFAQDVNDARVVLLGGWEGDIVEAIRNITPIVYDVDFSGDNLLIDVYLDIEGGRDETHYFAQLNMHDLTYDLISQECSGAMAYEKPRYEVVNVLSCEGVLTYDVLSGNTTLRNPHITSGWLSDAQFSPDGNYIAGSGGSPKSKFYVIEIDAELPAQMVTSTPIP